MDIQLIRVTVDEANDLWEMQVKAFLDLYEKYQDRAMPTGSQASLLTVAAFAVLSPV